MSVLTPPRHPRVDAALTLAREWCAGHRIGGASALDHAIQVALVLDKHLELPPPELVAAALVHDAPEYAPAELNLYRMLTKALGPEAARVVHAIHAEHVCMNNGGSGMSFPVDDPWSVQLSAAEKIVSLASLLQRARASGDPGGFWATRRSFLALVPYFRAFHAATAPRLPAGMALHLDAIVTRVEVATAALSTTPLRAERQR